MSINVLLSGLDGVKATGAGTWLARCPAHEDRHPSLSIRELADGRILLHDFAGCSVTEILDVLGLQFEVLFPGRSIEHAARARRPFPAADVLRALADEVFLILIIASDLRRGVMVKAEDFDRLQVAIERVQAARDLALGH